MTSLKRIQRIAELEFPDIVVQTDRMGPKLRVLLNDTSYADVWISVKLIGRFGFHGERRHLDGEIYRYDNFPDIDWANVSTFPCHFHDGTQTNVVASPFSSSAEQGFREFIQFARKRLSGSVTQ